MNHRTVKGCLLSLAIVLPSAAFANKPAPGSTESYSGSLAELATGVKSTPAQPTAIQSPRDSASKQATPTAQNGVMQESEFVDWSVNVRNASPRDAATGYREGGVNDTTHKQASGSTQRRGALINNENLSEARGAQTAQSGQFMSGGGGDGTGIRKPRPNNRSRKGRRMH